MGTVREYCKNRVRRSSYCPTFTLPKVEVWDVEYYTAVELGKYELVR
jgi:hypothetical protein